MKTYRPFEDTNTGSDTAPDLRQASDTSKDLRSARIRLFFDVSSLHVCWPSLAAGGPGPAPAADEPMFAYKPCRSCGLAHFVAR
jgi:hypothetical protein